MKIEQTMQFLKDMLRNLVLLLIIGLVLYINFPDMMNQVSQLYAAFIGPIAILIVIVAALPWRKRKRR